MTFLNQHRDPITRITRAVSKSQQTVSRDSKNALAYQGLAPALLIILMSVVGCQVQAGPASPPISFEGLCGLTQQQFSEMDEAQVQEWLQAKYGVAPTQRPWPGQGLMVLDGLGKGEESTTAFLQGGHLSSVSHSGRVSMPTFGQVVAKLGLPATIYRSRQLYEQVLYSIGLDYPKLGLSFFGGGLAPGSQLQHDGRLAFQLKEATQVDTLECYRPAASTQEALARMYSAEPDTLEAQSKARLPWPGFGAWVPLDVP